MNPWLFSYPNLDRRESSDCGLMLCFFMQVVQSLVLHCPLYPEAQSEWIGSLLSTLLPHMLVRLQGRSSRLLVLLPGQCML